MVSIKIRSRLLILLSVLTFSTAKVGAEILSAPPKILPIAKDKIIKRYAQGQPLDFFTYTGKWETKMICNKLCIVGTSDDKPAYLISLDMLSKNPKNFKLDFIIQDREKEFGFLYDKIGVIISKNKMYPAVFDKKAKLLQKSSKAGKEILRGINEKTNTLTINTGYDRTGGANQLCIIRINGTALQFKAPDKDSSFGAFIDCHSGIKINEIRWDIGNK